MIVARSPANAVLFSVCLIASACSSGIIIEWKSSAFDNALQQFDLAARKLKLSENHIAMVKQPRRVTEVMLPVRMDDGKPLQAISGKALGIGALAIGNIKYQTQRGLLETMLKADKALYLDLRDAFAEARKHAGLA